MDSNAQNGNLNQGNVASNSGTNPQGTPAVPTVAVPTPPAGQPVVGTVAPTGSSAAPAGSSVAPAGSSAMPAEATNSVSAQSTQVNTAQQVESPKKKNLLVIWLVVALVVLGVVGVVMGLMVSGVFGNGATPAPGGNQNGSHEDGGESNSDDTPQIEPQDQGGSGDDGTSEQTDIQYRDDLSIMASCVPKYRANNNGSLPESDGWGTFLNNYVRKTQLFDDPLTGNPYMVKAFGSVNDVDTSTLNEIPSDEFYVIYNATCNGDSVAPSDKEQEVTIVHSSASGTTFFCVSV